MVPWSDHLSESRVSESRFWEELEFSRVEKLLKLVGALSTEISFRAQVGLLQS